MSLGMPTDAPSVTDYGSYRPSWLDRVQLAIERSGAPWWSWYVGFWLIGFAPLTMIQWATGALPVGAFSVYHATLWGTAVFALALMHDLDRAAIGSLDAFKPALTACDADYEGLALRLTRLPAVRAGGVAVVGAAVGVAEVLTLPAATAEGLGLFTSPAARAVEVPMFVLGWVFFLTLIYHTFHQLGVVEHIYKRFTRLNLFRLDPIYGFSWLTARTALGIAALPYAYFLAANGTDPSGIEARHLALVLGISGMAGLVFVWPLRGIHRVLSAEKVRLLRESSLRLEAALAELHARADAREYAEMDGLNKLISSLVVEQATVEKISTWPWKPDTFRLFVTALLLPLLAFLGQRVLASALGF